MGAVAKKRALAYELWVSLGERRNLRKLQVQLLADHHISVSMRTLEGWKGQGRWLDRLAGIYDEPILAERKEPPLGFNHTDPRKSTCIMDKQCVSYLRGIPVSPWTVTRAEGMCSECCIESYRGDGEVGQPSVPLPQATVIYRR